VASLIDVLSIVDAIMSFGHQQPQHRRCSGFGRVSFTQKE